MMTPEQRDQLKKELLELHFDCHPDPDALRERIARDPEVAALEREMRARAALLTEAAHLPTDFLATAPRDTSGGSARGRGGRGVFVREHAPWIAAAAVLLTVILGPIGLKGYRDHQVRALERAGFKLVVTAPASPSPGAPFRCNVATWSFKNEERPAAVSWRVTALDGTTLASNEDQSNGNIDIVVPPSLTPPHAIDVSATSEGLTETARLELRPRRSAPLVHIASDKPVYRPEETARFRVTVLDRLTLKPREGTYIVKVLGPRGEVVTDWRPVASEGVLSVSWNIPQNVTGGRHDLVLRNASDEFTVESLRFTVRRFETPKLIKRLTLAQKTYAPGTRGSAELTVHRAGGGAVVASTVDVFLVVDGESHKAGSTTLDADGKATLPFTVPSDVKRGDARLVARVNDGALVETIVEPFVVPTGTITVNVYPEGGDLIAGLSSRVYFEAHDALDRPISVSGRLVDEENRPVLSVSSEHEGRGAFTFTPALGVAYRLVIDDPIVTDAVLPPALAMGATLRAVDPVTPASAPLRLAMATTEAGPWMVGVYLRGALVAQRPFDGGAPVNLSLDLDDAVAGVLRVTVFDSTLKPVAERLVQRLPAQRVALGITKKRERVSPGGNQEITIVAHDEKGSPVARAILGAWVTDDAVFGLGGKDRPGLADQTWLAADLEAVEDLGLLLGVGAEVEARVDLMLGTQGWRRFAWRDPKAFVTSEGENGRRFVMCEGLTAAPSVAESSSASTAALSAARSDLFRSQRYSDLAIVAAVLAGIGLLIGACSVAVKRFVEGPLTSRQIVRRFAYSFFAGSLVSSLLLVLTFPLLVSSIDPPGKLAAVAFEVEESLKSATPRDSLEYPYIEDFNVEIAQGSVVLQDMMGAWAGSVEASRSLGDTSGTKAVALESFSAVDATKPFADESRHAIEGFDDTRRSADAQNRSADRVYAHRRRGQAGAREDFTETVYWNPILVTDEEGQATFDFDVSDSVTTWRLLVDAHGAGRVGQETTTFESRLPLALAMTLPPEVIAGDRFQIPLAIDVDDEEVSSARVDFAALGALTTSVTEASTKLVNGRGRVFADITAVAAAERVGSLSLRGTAGPWRDSLVRTLRVSPRGYPHRRSQSGMLEGEEGIVIPIPAEFVADSLTAKLTVYPSILSGLEEGMEGMLATPGGCFEQTSSKNYPNVLALQFMDATNSENPTLAAKARTLLASGYDRLTGFECKSGGFEWYGKDPGNEELTAYGLLQFHDMARVHPVNSAMMARTREWLRARLTEDGRFAIKSGRHWSYGAVPAEVTDAYITYALAATKTESDTLTTALDRLEARIPITNDPYELALATCALAEAQRTRAATAGRDLLVRLRDEDGSLIGKKTSITGSGARDLRVETTSFAVLAWLSGGQHNGAAVKAVEWLRDHRRGDGTFGATQATIMALKALCAYQSQRPQEIKPGCIEVWLGDQLLARQEFSSGQRQALALTQLGRHLVPGENKVRLVLTGGNAFPWALDVRYHSDLPANDPDAQIAITTRLWEPTVEEGRTVALEVTVQNRSEEDVPMTVALIGIPASLTVPTEVLDALTESEAIDAYEILGQTIALYWRGMQAGTQRTVTLDALATIPGETLGEASRAYLYYTADAVRWAPPLRIVVTPSSR